MGFYGRLNMGLTFIIFGAVLVFIGACFVAGGYFVQKHQRNLQERCTATVEAELVDTVPRSTRYSDTTHITYHGVYAFLPEENLHLKSQNEIGYATPEEVLGPHVTIRYNPNKPAEFIIPGESEEVIQSDLLPGFKRGGIAMLVGGVLLVVVGLVVGM